MERDDLVRDFVWDSRAICVSFKRASTAVEVARGGFQHNFRMQACNVEIYGVYTKELYTV